MHFPAKSAMFIACLFLFALGNPQGPYLQAQAQQSVRVVATRVLDISTSYQSFLERLEGEEPSRAMFNSQHVQLLSYVPRKNASASEETSSNEADPTVRATIDIVGCSAEFGLMSFTQSIVANDKLTTIDVVLNRGMGMLVGQYYQYRIVPSGKDRCSITITQTLDVLLMQRKLGVVNKIIKKVTCREATSQVHQLTNAMASCVGTIATRSKVDENTIDDGTIDESTELEVSDEPTENDEMDSEQSPSDSSAEETPADAVAPQPKPEEQVSESKRSETQPQNNDDQFDNPIEQVSEPQKQTTSEQPTTEPSTTIQPGPANDPVLPADKVESNPILKVKISFQSIRKGSVRIAIFDSKDQYNKFDARKEESKQGKAFRMKELKVGASNVVECEFKDVPPGSYAIAAFYDKDSNQKLNASFLGLPSEPYGFSHDARGNLGSPEFEEATITFDREHPSFSFSLK